MHRDPVDILPGAIASNAARSSTCVGNRVLQQDAVDHRVLREALIASMTSWRGRRFGKIDHHRFDPRLLTSDCFIFT